MQRCTDAPLSAYCTVTVLHFCPVALLHCCTDVYQKKPCPPNLVSNMSTLSTSTRRNFFNRFYFLTPVDYSLWSEREIWPFIKVAISLKPEMPCLLKLACMHFTSSSTCVNFLSCFYFLTPMDYSRLKGIGYL